MKIYLAGNGQGNPNYRRICFKVKTTKVIMDHGYTYWKTKRGTLLIWEI